MINGSQPVPAGDAGKHIPAGDAGKNAWRCLLLLTCGILLALGGFAVGSLGLGGQPQVRGPVRGSPEQLIGGRVKMSVALRRHQLRYSDTGEAGPVAADTRIAMLADLLGLTSWGQPGRP